MRKNKKERAFKHLTYTDRLRIEKWLGKGMKPPEIAGKLRVDVSTVYRELHRGEYEKLDGATWEMVTAYSATIAEEKYQQHLRNKGPDLKIGNDHELAQYIEETIIREDCSPAAVMGYAKMEGRTFKTTVSTPTIYSYINKGVFLNITQKDLPRRGKKKRSYKKVEKKAPARAPAGESIEQRPEEVMSREEFGHWEMDTVVSGNPKKKKQGDRKPVAKTKKKKALLVLTERKTRWELILLMPDRKAETVVKAMDALERKYGAVNFRKLFRSITVDNGSEFADAAGIERSAVNKTLARTKVYFCHPYSSWERGSNENQNIMIRRKYPKGTDFAKVSKEQIAETERWINNYPRKIHGYLSSAMMFKECLREIGLAA